MVISFLRSEYLIPLTFIVSSKSKSSLYALYKDENFLRVILPTSFSLNPSFLTPIKSNLAKSMGSLSSSSARSSSFFRYYHLIQLLIRLQVLYSCLYRLLLFLPVFLLIKVSSHLFHHFLCQYLLLLFLCILK